jgi:D-proline reductase (dithiol) PrdB
MENFESSGPGRPIDAVSYIDRTRRLYSSQKPYNWAENDGAAIPWTPIDGSLAEKRIVLVSSGGVHRADQEPFHFRNDTSHREIPMNTPADQLRVAHFGYDTRDAKRDTGCVMPMEALSRLAREGRIGSLVDRALSFMGGIYSQRRVCEEIAPRFLEIAASEEVDLFLLVPV